MNYPRILIHPDKYRHNVRKMQSLLGSKAINMMVVSKVYRAVQPLIDVLGEENIDYIADSRLQNLKTMNTKAQKVLLRIPALSSLEETLLHSDISLNSEWKTLEKLNEKAKELNLTHKIILMIDIGDLREGIYYKDNLLPLIESVEDLSNIDLYGLGTNVTCYGGVLPTLATMDKLKTVVKEVETFIKRPLTMVSGGNSSHIAYLDETGSFINNLRIGEALVLGRETSFGHTIEDFKDDVFTLEAEIIELKEKPSYPEGKTGMNAFGKTPHYEDKGNRQRAIIALGKQDVDYRELYQTDQAIVAVGSSSDHIILDVTDSKIHYEVGDILTFKLTYASILSLMTSPYVVKHYE